MCEDQSARIADDSDTDSWDVLIDCCSERLVYFYPDSREN